MNWSKHWLQSKKKKKKKKKKKTLSKQWLQINKNYDIEGLNILQQANKVIFQSKNWKIISQVGS